MKGYYSYPHSYGGSRSKWKVRKWKLGVCTTFWGNWAIYVRRDIRQWLEIPSTCHGYPNLLLPASASSRPSDPYLWTSSENQTCLNPIIFQMELFPLALGPHLLFHLWSSDQWMAPSFTQPTKAETWVSSSLHFLHFPLIFSPHILVITNSYIYLKSTHFCNWHRRCACSKKNSWFIPLTFQFLALTVFLTLCISARKKPWNLSWLFSLPHPTSQKILLALPLTYIQILTTSRYHPFYPGHATKTSCLDYCISPAHAASGCSYVQFPTWKPK